MARSLVRRLRLFRAWILSVCVVGGGGGATAFAATVHADAVEVNGVVAPVGTVDSTYLLMSNPTPTPAGHAAFTFTASGSESAWSAAPLEVLRVSVRCNATSWKLRLYSSNFSVCPGDGQYGGARRVGGGAVIAAMGWRVLSSFSAVGPTVAVPGVAWNYVIDRCNGNFASAVADGYANIAFGGPTYTRIVQPSQPDPYPELSSPTAYFYVHAEADLKDRPAGNYQAPLVLELVTQ
jgi:hypothetical protein